VSFRGEPADVQRGGYLRVAGPEREEEDLALPAGEILDARRRFGGGRLGVATNSSISRR